MNKGVLLLVLGIVVLAACGGMYSVGSKNPNLSELKDFWYMPLPLGVILIFIGMGKMGGG